MCNLPKCTREGLTICMELNSEEVMMDIYVLLGILLFIALVWLFVWGVVKCFKCCCYKRTYTEIEVD